MTQRSSLPAVSRPSTMQKRKHGGSVVKEVPDDDEFSSGSRNGSSKSRQAESQIKYDFLFRPPKSTSKYKQLKQQCQLKAKFNMDIEQFKSENRRGGGRGALLGSFVSSPSFAGTEKSCMSSGQHDQQVYNYDNLGSTNLVIEPIHQISDSHPCLQTDLFSSRQMDQPLRKLKTIHSFDSGER